MNRTIWGRGVIVCAIILVIAVVIGLVAGGNTEAGSNTDPASDVAPPVGDRIVDLLTVKTTSVDCVKLVGNTADLNGTPVYGWDEGSLKGTPPRLWSDAISTPFAASDPMGILNEMQRELCVAPLLGVTYANFFARMEVGNVKVVDLNDWLKPYAVDPSQVNDQASEFAPLLDVADPSQDQVVAAAQKQAEYRTLAERLGTLLTRFWLGEVQAQKSVLNYHLTAGGLSVGGLPEVGINPNQEDLPALLLAVTEKDACVPIKVIGINVGDKRPEEFAPPECNPAPPKPGEPAPEPPPSFNPPPCKCAKPPRKGNPPTTVPAPTTTQPPRSTTTTTVRPTTTTIPGSSTTTTTIPTCGRKSHWDPQKRQCVPDLPTGTTVPPPPTTAPRSTTTQPPRDNDSGPGAPPRDNPITPPTTVRPPAAPPTTQAPPTTRVEF